MNIDEDFETADEVSTVIISTVAISIALQQCCNTLIQIF